MPIEDNHNILISPLSLGRHSGKVQETYIANRTPTKIPFGRGVDYTFKCSTCQAFSLC